MTIQPYAFVQPNIKIKKLVVWNDFLQIFSYSFPYNVYDIYSVHFHLSSKTKEKE